MTVQFDRDRISAQADLFFSVRKLLLEYEEIWEVKKQNITSYFCKEGGICYLRVKDDVLIVGLFQGICLEEIYDLVPEKAKQIRHLNYKNEAAFEPDFFHNIIKDSMICAMQRKERAALKRKLRQKSSNQEFG